VWKVDSQGRPTLVANIHTPHLEGVITIANDAARWGPWAGKILTGDESLLDENFKSAPLIFSIATNGFTRSYSLGIQPEDFDVIPADRSLYCINYNGVESKILKLSKAFFTNYVGDLLITHAGEFHDKPKLFIVRWTGSQFVTRSIPLPDSFLGNFEHVTFAPIELPEIQ
jgi:hypothetical protein